MSEGLSRRKLLERAALGGAALSLPGLRAAPAAARSVTRRKARTRLIVLEEETAENLDYDGPSISIQPNANIISNLYPRLVTHGLRRDRFGTLIPLASRFAPGLATSWHKRGLTWTFHLRRGVRSAAGHELTADDVVWTYARAKSISGAIPFGWFIASTADIFGPDVFKGPDFRNLHGEVTKVDRYTVRIKQQHADELFLEPLTIFGQGIFDSKEVMKHTTSADPWGHNWIGTQDSAGFGAYSLTHWQKGVSATLEAHPHANYFRGKPHFETIVVRKVPSSAQRVAAIQRGDADVVFGLSPQEFASIRRSGKADVRSWFGNLYLQLALNYKADPWGGGGDPTKARLLRQAIAFAIPYNEIIGKDYLGTARKWNGLINSSFYGAKKYPGRYTTNLARAKDLLAKAGYPGGRGLGGPGLTLSYVAERQSTLEPVATSIQTALARIGVHITLNPIPATQFADHENLKKDLPMYLIDTEIVIGADAGYASLLQFVSTANGGQQNSENWVNDRFDALYFKQLLAHGRTRLKQLHEMQDILMSELPRIPIVESATQMAIRKGITGWSPDNVQGRDFATFRPR
jgi:peptide/nickel transport system substrate-binding protein